MTVPYFRPHADDPSCGVVLGCYGLPQLIEIQICLLRERCGPVPILVADDCSPGCGPQVETGSPYDLLQTICGRYAEVTLWSNAVRIGHTGGDVSAFWKGLVWAAALGLRILAKLSQRFLIDRPRWLQDSGRELLLSGLPLAGRRCRGPHRFDLRTEACLLDVAQWQRPEILSRITPRRYGRSFTAETILYRTLVEHCGGVFWPWDLLSEYRHTPSPGVIWHCANDTAAYLRLAERFGLGLDPHFHTRGWQRDTTYVYG